MGFLVTAHFLLPGGVVRQGADLFGPPGDLVGLGDVGAGLVLAKVHHKGREEGVADVSGGRCRGGGCVVAMGRGRDDLWGGVPVGGLIRISGFVGFIWVYFMGRGEEEKSSYFMGRGEEKKFGTDLFREGRTFCV